MHDAGLIRRQQIATFAFGDFARVDHDQVGALHDIETDFAAIETVRAGCRHELAGFKPRAVEERLARTRHQRNHVDAAHGILARRRCPHIQLKTRALLAAEVRDALGIADRTRGLRASAAQG